MRQLGRSLEEQADRILRDVQAAHRRMQADLRVQSGDELPDSSSSGRGTRPSPAPEPAPRDGAATAPFGGNEGQSVRGPRSPGLDEAVAGLARHQPRGGGLEGRHRPHARRQAEPVGSLAGQLGHHRL